MRKRIEPDGLSPIDVSVPECASVTSTLPGEIATTIQYVSPGDELFNITRERLGPNDGHVVVEAPFPMRQGSCRFC